MPVSPEEKTEKMDTSDDNQETSGTEKASDGGGDSESDKGSEAQKANAEQGSDRNAGNAPPKDNKKSGRRNSRNIAALNTSSDEATAASSTTAKPNATTPKSATSKTPKNVGDKKRQSITGGPATTPPPAPAQDSHPYARGSVIEVLHIPATAVGKTTSSIQAANSSDPWYWSEDSSLCSTTSESSSMDIEEKAGEADKDEDMKDGSAAKEDKKGDSEGEKDNKGDTKDGNKSPTSPSRNHHHHHHHHHQHAASVRLCDIIDRITMTNVFTPSGQQAWRYYVHYRDFNRR
jgi:hypothetical protein